MAKKRALEALWSGAKSEKVQIEESKMNASSDASGNTSTIEDVSDAKSIKNVPNTDSDEEEPKLQETIPKKKVNKGGRPTNKEKGIVGRKQYTLTLKEETYELFKAKAQEEDISFAKYMERAGYEYIKNHS